MDEVNVTACYDGDTKRTHRYLIKERDISGALYLSKELKKLPESVRISLVVKAEEKAGGIPVD